MFFEDDFKRDPKTLWQSAVIVAKVSSKCMNIPTNVFTLPDASWE